MPPSPPPPAPPPPWLLSSPVDDRKANDTRSGDPATGEGGLAETRAPTLLLLHACRPPLVVVAVDVDVALPEIPPNAWDSDTHERSTSKLVKTRAPEACLVMLDACVSRRKMWTSLSNIMAWGRRGCFCFPHDAPRLPCCSLVSSSLFLFFELSVLRDPRRSSTTTHLLSYMLLVQTAE